MSLTLRIICAILIATGLFCYARTTKSKVNQNLVLRTCERLVLLQNDLGKELIFLTAEISSLPKVNGAPEVNRMASVNDLLIILEVWYRYNCEVDPNALGR